MPACEAFIINPRKSAITGLRALLTAVTSLALILFSGCGGSTSTAIPVTKGGVDFSMTVTPGSQTVAAGKVATYTLTFNPPASVGAVSFTISGVPAGIQASISGGFDPVKGTKNLNVITTTNTPVGGAQMTVTANDSTGSQTVTFGVTVAPAEDFTLSVTPNSQIVRPGGSTTFTVNVGFSARTVGPVNLTTVGLPAGATASFDQSSFSASGTATLTVTAGPQIVTETDIVDVVGSDSSGSLSDELFLSIFPADFFLRQSVGPVEVTAGGNISGEIDVANLGSTPGTVTFSASGLPNGATATFSPSTVTGAGSTIVTINTEAFAAPDIYTVTITGTDASGSNFVTFPFMIVTGNFNAGFFLTARPIDQEVDAGQSASYIIVATPTSGPLPPLTFSVQIALSDVTGNVVPDNAPGTFELIVDTLSTQGDNGTSVTVTAMGPNGPQTLQLGLTIDIPPPDP